MGCGRGCGWNCGWMRKGLWGRWWGLKLKVEEEGVGPVNDGGRDGKGLGRDG